MMANIGTTIAPWMIFFQQSAVVDKQMKEKDIPWGKFDTIVGAIFTIIVAVFVIIVDRDPSLWHGHRECSPGRPGHHGDTPVGGDTSRHRPFRCRVPGSDLYRAHKFVGIWRGFRVGALAELQGEGGVLVLRLLLPRALSPPGQLS